MKTHTKAIVTVQVNVSVGPYGDEWTVGEIMKQAAREGVEQVERHFNTRADVFEVNGKPSVRIIMVDQ